MLPKLASLLAVATAIACHCIAPASADTATDSNDVKVLQYALTLEHLEAEFYSFGQAKFSAANFTAASYPAGTWDYFNVIKNHESAHVDFLTGAIGSGAAGKCQYDFSSITDVDSYVKTAAALESTGVSAYDGAINSITSTAYQQAAATIATIEARHTAFIRNILQVTDPDNRPFPSDFDTAATPATVVATASKYIVTNSCPYNLGNNLPAIRPNGVATDNTYNNYKATGSQTASALYSQAQFDNDLRALNYALTLEQLESAFYVAGLAVFNTTAQWTNAYPTNGEKYQTYVGLIRDHEVSHVKALTTTIQTRGGTPQQQCQYDFSKALVDIPTFLTYAAILENTGVSAYDGAVNTIVDTGLQQVAATIATVEGRHAAWLNGVLGKNATADTSTRDSPVAPSDVLAAVRNTNFIKSGSCTLPTVPTVVSYVAVNQASATVAASWVSAALLVGSIVSLLF